VAFPQASGDFYWTVAGGNTVQKEAMPKFTEPLPTTWHTELLPLATVPLPATLSTKDGTIVPTFGGALNLYFPTSPPASAPRLAEIFGFHPGANLWPRLSPATALSGHSPETALVAPAVVCLEQPAYMLLDFGLEHMNANCSHRCGQDVKGQLFGKVCMHCPWRLERNYPIQKVSTGSAVINQFRVRIYTPWHSLMPLHGRNWSMTLVLIGPNRPVRTECA